MKAKAILLGAVIAVFAAGQVLAAAANVTGRWTGEVTLANGNKLPFVADLQQAGEVVTGKLAGINGAPDVTLIDGKLTGDQLTFSGLRRVQNGDARFDYVGKVAADGIHVQIIRADGSQPTLTTHLTKSGG